MTINFTLELSKDKYPLLDKLKQSELSETIYDIFNTGYNYRFPNIEINNNNINDIELNNNVKNLGKSLEKVIGFGSSSSRKGEFAENILEKLINDRYGNIKYTNTAQTNHCGDAWLRFDSFDSVVMLESKNYTATVNKDEIEKMKNDMITNNIQWGILYHGILKFKVLGILIFIHLIIMVTCIQLL